MFTRVIKQIIDYRLRFNVEVFLSTKVPKLNICLSSFLLGIAVSIYILVFSYFTILRHLFFQSSAWDLGIFMQSLYTTSFHGKIFAYTLEQPVVNPSGSFFGIHFSPILFLLVPLYRLAPFAETLLILQSFILAIGAFVLYLISHHIIENRFASFSLGISYLLYTPLHAVNWFDFHVQAFIPLFFFLMFYFYLKKEYEMSFLFVILLLCIVEMVPILVFPFGLYCLISNRENKKVMIYSVAIMCASIAFFLLASLVKSSLNPMYSNTYGAWQIWGSNIPQIIMNVVTKPVETLTYFLTVFPLEKALYFLWLTVPLFLIPLLARKEFIFLAMPWIALTFLSTYTGYFVYHYGAFVIPQIFISTVYGLKQISNFSDNATIKKSLIFRYSKWVLIGTIIAFLLISPFGIVPQVKSVYVHGLPENSSHKETLRQILQLIPRNASIYTSFHIAPHLANRLELYAHAVPDKPPDYIIVDFKSPDSTISLGIFGGTPIAGMKELLGKYDYSLMVSIDGIYVYSLSEFATPIFKPLNISFNYKDLILDSGRVMQNDASISGMVLNYNPDNWPTRFWHTPHVALPQGKYEILYKVKFDGVLEGHLLTFGITSDSGRKLLARKYVYSHDITPGVWNDVKLEFSINESKAFVEFWEMCPSNTTNHYFDLMMLNQLSLKNDFTFGSISFNHLDLPVVQGKILHNGIVMHEKGDNKTRLFGLYTELPPGEYLVKFWLRVDIPSQSHILSFEVEDFNGTRLTKTTISIEEFNQMKSWQCFSVNFTLNNQTGVVKMQGTCNEETLTSFSYLDVMKVNG